MDLVEQLQKLQAESLANVVKLGDLLVLVDMHLDDANLEECANLMEEIGAQIGQSNALFMLAASKGAEVNDLVDSHGALLQRYQELYLFGMRIGRRIEEEQSKAASPTRISN